MKKNIIIASLLVLIMMFGASKYLGKSNVSEVEENIKKKVTYQAVIDTIYTGIEIAKENGGYKCCIEPACTMCYVSPNKWNYGKAGTCACDEFIARGEDPCPQCIKGLSYIHDENNTSCSLDSQSTGCTASLEEVKEL